MNYKEPLNINNIDLSNIVYTKHRSNNNKKIILIKYKRDNELQNFVFQTPTLLNLFKADELQHYSEIEIALSGKKDSKIQRFLKFLNNLEEKIKKDAVKQSSTWFDINKNNDSVTFQKSIRDSDNYDNGTIKFKIFNKGDLQTRLQIKNTNINVSEIPENSECKMILECYAIWINGNNEFGILLRPILISFKPKVYNYKFIQDSEDESGNESDYDKFNAPETELHTNIFMKLPETVGNNISTTTQLEINELLNKIDINTTDFNIITPFKDKDKDNIEQYDNSTSSIDTLNKSYLKSNTSSSEEDT